MDLPVTYAGMVYDRTRALYDGDVRVEGLALRYLRTGVEELFWRQGRYAEFDAAEFSLGAYLAPRPSNRGTVAAGCQLAVPETFAYQNGPPSLMRAAAR